MKNALMLTLVACCIAASSVYAQAEIKTEPATAVQDTIAQPPPQVNQESETPKAVAQEPSHVKAKEPSFLEQEKKSGYTIGIDDMLEISVLQPEQLLVTVTVAPDGFITFPYIGSVSAKDKTLDVLQQEIQNKLADGYMNYPVVSVSLKESRSKKFFVYGEVARPGTYLLDEYTTVLKAISIAGGFTKYGSAARVKVLRPHQENNTTEVIKVNISAAMQGKSQEDAQLQPGDTVVVSEGVF